MRHLNEYRDAVAARALAALIARSSSRHHTLMELCGGQTHAIVRYGIDQLLAEHVTFIHGPGCPVCVTPIACIDQAVALTAMPQVILASFGDMLRVPGSVDDLFKARSRGGDVRVVYSPMDVLALALANPDREVVFFGVGFETTAPATAMLVAEADRQRVKNLSLLVSHVLVPPAMEMLLRAPECRVEGFLAAGHVCAITGVQDYVPLAERYRVPIAVCGFEPLDILQATLSCVRQLEEGRHEVEIAYGRAVRPDGNPTARTTVNEVYETVSQEWRGIGRIERSGLALRPRYAAYDAARRFDLGAAHDPPVGDCISGRILQGLSKPAECPSFGTRCTPEMPLGAPMVSSEGACAAWYRYRGVDLGHGDPCMVSR